MTKNMKLNPHERNIHIAAVSDIYTVYEIVPERKAVARLEQIRGHFVELNNRHGNKAKLSVKTGVHNPEFSFTQIKTYNDDSQRRIMQSLLGRYD